MRRSYRSASTVALLAMLLVTMQAVQLAVLRAWWWGWEEIASGVLLHTHLWATVAASLAGTWLVRSSVVEGASLRLRTAVRSQLVVLAAALWPAVIIAFAGDLMLAAGVKIISTGWFGEVSWLLTLAGPCWTVAGWLWGWWIGLHAPWKSAWLLAPGVPIAVFHLGTVEASLGRALPLLPIANPFGTLPLVTRVHIVLAAVSVLLFMVTLVTARRHSMLATGILAGIIAVPWVTSLPTVALNPAAAVSNCSEHQGFTICHPAAFTTLVPTMNRVALEVRRAHPDLLQGVEGITTVPHDERTGLLVVSPESGWTGPSMMASDADLRFDIASALLTSKTCVGGELQPALLSRTASLLQAQGAEMFVHNERNNQLISEDDDDYRAATAKIEGWSEQKLGTFLAQRRKDPNVCDMSAQELLAQP